MLNIIQPLLVFLISLGVIVFLHELGHYFAARFFGVRVKQFSIGFGRCIAGYQAQSGTVFTIGLIPLGGFVRMLNSSDEDCVPILEQYAFDKQAIWKRLVIVLAGPVVNFILAVVLFMAVFLIGIKEFKPILDAPHEGSMAKIAGVRLGDEIQFINDKAVRTWSDLSLQLTKAISTSNSIQITLSREKENNLVLSLKAEPSIFKETNDPISALGFYNLLPIKPIIGHIEKGSPADQAGLVLEQQIVSIDGVDVPYWQHAVREFQSKPNQNVTIELFSPKRGLVETKHVLLGSKDSNGEQYGFLGIGPTSQLETVGLATVNTQLPFLGAVHKAFDKTGQYSIVILKIVGKLITGQATLKYLNGPISMAKSASRSFDAGLVYWLSIIAGISVSLGVLNLLPIPMLDGGHALFYIIEAVKGSPVSETVLAFSYQVGFLLLGAMMILAVANDLSLF